MKRTFNFGKIDFTGRGRAINRVTVDMEYTEEKCFSVSSNVCKCNKTDIICGGQCLDEIAPHIKNPIFSEILRLWKLYHLNGMHPECEHQAALGWREIAAKKITLYHWRMSRDALEKQVAAKLAAVDALKCGQKFIPTKEQQFFASLDYSLTTSDDVLPEDKAEYYEPERASLYAEGRRHTEVKELGWLRENEHPDGVLLKPCPVCGYKYGSGWKHFPIPKEDEAIIYKLLKTDI